MLALPGVLLARNGPASEDERLASLPAVKSISIKGNKALTTEEIREIMSTWTRDSFLGTGLFSGAPRPFKTEEFEKDITLIKKLYTFKGYFFADVDTTVVRDKKGNVRIDIRIRENQPTRIDSIRYSGLNSVPEELRKRYFRRSRLKPERIFSVETLIEERDRSLDFFRNYGYTFFSPDSINITVDTLGLKAGIHFMMNLPERHVYGPTRVIVNDPLRNERPPKSRTFVRDNVSVTIYGDQKFSPDIFPSAIAWKEGGLTSQSVEQRTLENFGTTNLFSSIAMERDSVQAGAIPMTVRLEPAPKHLIEPKLLVDNRYGALFIGGAIAYENRNLFGAGQQFRISTNYGSQTSASTNYLSSLSPDQYEKAIPYEFNVKANLVIPKIGRQGSSYTGTLEYSQAQLPILLKSRREIIRGTYSSQPTRNSRLNFDFFELEVVSRDSLRGFKQLFTNDLAENINIDPTTDKAVNRALDSLLQTRLNQTFRLQYNFSNRHNALFRRSATWNVSVIAEESGGLLWLIDKYIDTSNRAGFTDADPQIFGTGYNQYLKLDTQVAITKDLSPDRQIAARLALGWMGPYGKAESTPEEHRFYAGGSNSMRGWLFGQLGPGNCASDASSNFGADIRAELGLEYRMKLFKLFGQPSGVTLFSDIGNIWDRSGPYALSLKSLGRDFAWDLGAGVRLGSPIGPFRFDFAWKIHDPANPRRWRITHNKLSDFTFNFGIGEAF
ncbi:MAG: sorting and assembly machinery component 50 [Chlorobiaceae bacterium]|nr:sorting and assembly machinery component 50 [Chlorobiaceae bacterium]